MCVCRIVQADKKMPCSCTFNYCARLIYLTFRSTTCTVDGEPHRCFTELCEFLNSILPVFAQQAVQAAQRKVVAERYGDSLVSAVSSLVMNMLASTELLLNASEGWKSKISRETWQDGSVDIGKAGSFYQRAACRLWGLVRDVSQRSIVQLLRYFIISCNMPKAI
jgi:hypothetical protein